jgi:hypothetical protein
MHPAGKTCLDNPVYSNGRSEADDVGARTTNRSLQLEGEEPRLRINACQRPWQRYRFDTSIGKQPDRGCGQYDQADHGCQQTSI